MTGDKEESQKQQRSFERKRIDHGRSAERGGKPSAARKQARILLSIRVAPSRHMPTVDLMTRQICRLLSLVLAIGTALPVAQGQLVRQANTTLTLPADLPSATGYTLQDAIGLNFAAP